MKKSVLGKSIVGLATVVSLSGSFGTAYAQTVSNNNTRQLTTQQQATLQKLSDPQVNQDIQNAINNLPVLKVAPGATKSQTVVVDGFRLVETTNGITPNVGSKNSNTITPMTGYVATASNSVACYDIFGAWIYTVSYYDSFYYDGTSVHAYTPSMGWSHAWWLAFNSFYPGTPYVDNYGNVGYSSDSCDIKYEITQYGVIQDTHFNGYSYAYPDGYWSCTL